MIYRDATAYDIRHVCRNLRALNAREAFALRDHDDPNLLAAELIDITPHAIRHFCFANANDSEPVALAGAWIVGPRRAFMSMRSTDQWLTINQGVYRFMRQVFVPMVLRPNVRLAETEILADGPSRDWLLRLDCVECLPALPRGKHGEMFLTCAWVNREEVFNGDNRRTARADGIQSEC